MLGCLGGAAHDQPMLPVDVVDHIANPANKSRVNLARNLDHAKRRRVRLLRRWRLFHAEVFSRPKEGIG